MGAVVVNVIINIVILHDVADDAEFDVVPKHIKDLGDPPKKKSDRSLIIGSLALLYDIRSAEL